MNFIHAITNEETAPYEITQINGDPSQETKTIMIGVDLLGYAAVQCQSLTHEAIQLLADRHGEWTKFNYEVRCIFNDTARYGSIKKIIQ